MNRPGLHLDRHLACLRELDRSSEPPPRSLALVLGAAAALTVLGLFGCHLLEGLVLQKLGMR